MQGLHWVCWGFGWSQECAGMLFRGYRRTALGNPFLERCVVFVVRYFNHSYLMSPLYCLGASGFLPFGCLGWGCCASNSSCYSLVFVEIAQWGVMPNQIAGIGLQQARSFNIEVAHCAAPHLCVHQILAFTLIQQQGANATTTFTPCSSSLSVSTVQRRNSCGIHSGSCPSATRLPSIALSAWPYATRYETAPFHGYLTSLGSRS